MLPTMTARCCVNGLKYILPSPITTRYFSSATQQEYDNIFEMMASCIRYGNGVTSEVGLDCANLGVVKACLVTDPKLVNMDPVKNTRESLDRAGINHEVYSNVCVEPTDKSILDAISFCQSNKFDCFVAVGGGSVIDTAKAANLFAPLDDVRLLDYVNPPIGKGLPVKHKLKPLIAIPTTAGTGSEATSTSVFDIVDARYKVGIGNRAIKPTLALVDPLHTMSLPKFITAYPGLDVLCHAIESFTALPFNHRVRPTNPSLRPPYQGSNPISDVWCRQALSMVAKYLVRAVFNNDDIEARSSMLLASTYAGVGFGNAGVHLCHAMSYPISGLVKNYVSPDYPSDHPLVPHGLSVMITGPAVFKFTAPSNPQRHLEAAQLLGGDVSNVRHEDAGKFLADILLKYMYDLDVPNGLSALGYTADDTEALAKGAVVQHRVTRLSPKPATVEDLQKMLSDSLTIY